MTARTHPFIDYSLTHMCNADRVAFTDLIPLSMLKHGLRWDQGEGLRCLRQKRVNLLINSFTLSLLQERTSRTKGTDPTKKSPGKSLMFSSAKMSLAKSSVLGIDWSKRYILRMMVA